MSFWPPRPRQPFIGLAIAAVLGIVAADRWETPPVWAFALCALGVLAVLVRPAPVTAWLLCGLAFFELHTIRHYGSEARQFSHLLVGGPRVVHIPLGQTQTQTHAQGTGVGEGSKFASRGDTVSVLDKDGFEIARGMIAYSDRDAVRILGKRSADIEALLGFRGRAEMIHRDDLVMMRGDLATA